jgi:hypothetical protein
MAVTLLGLLVGQKLMVTWRSPLRTVTWTYEAMRLLPTLSVHGPPRLSLSSRTNRLRRKHPLASGELSQLALGAIFAWPFGAKAVGAGFMPPAHPASSAATVAAKVSRYNILQSPMVGNPPVESDVWSHSFLIAYS